jgi:GGDEF domain-containing protein
VLGIDTLRNIVENSYFGLFFGSHYGLFPGAIATVLGNPLLLIVPKLLNIASGCLVLGLLLLRWLLLSIAERAKSDRRAEQLLEMTEVDGMTGLFNRSHFLNLAERERVRSQRYARPLSLLMVDIDQFKAINDGHGHDIGDRVVAEVASILRNGKRTSDVAGRLGGDEFAVLLPETSLGVTLARRCSLPLGLQLSVRTGLVNGCRQMLSEKLQRLIDGKAELARYLLYVLIIEHGTQLLRGYRKVRPRAEPRLNLLA